ncbi:hypothetical protein P1P91_05950 [Halomonas piscis]|uniref:Uncharacterized protein n=1 Tax=Halomonas piscis TaxID=3031727 RepID=A0ABY9Z3G4_9GAMM|nr:hypothetical protein [Halomonas piscis]WNK21216.1 hypothetical protein P1P91_05950 [Halomonas piscis]
MAANSPLDWLYRVARQPLEQPLDSVTDLAEAVWYHGYVPTAKELKGLQRAVEQEQFQRVLCALELISQYPVCQRKTARYLQTLTDQFHEQLFGPAAKPTQGRYSPSLRWGLKERTEVDPKIWTGA